MAREWSLENRPWDPVQDLIHFEDLPEWRQELLSDYLACRAVERGTKQDPTLTGDHRAYTTSSLRAQAFFDQPPGFRKLISAVERLIGNS